MFFEASLEERYFLVHAVVARIVFAQPYGGWLCRSVCFMLLSVFSVILKVNYNVCCFLRQSLPPATSTALPPLGKKSMI